MTYLSRRSAAEYLSSKGLTLSRATLATYACRGGGPPFALFNNRATYRQGDLDAWAEAQIASPYSTAVERRAAQRMAHANVEAA